MEQIVIPATKKRVIKDAATKPCYTIRLDSLTTPQEKNMHLSKFLLSSVLSVTIMAQTSWAHIATTQDLLSHHPLNDAQTTINGYLDRSEVSGKLEAMGIDLQTAKERVAALSDEEASRLAAEIETLPAGGDGIGSLVGAAVFIFIVLLITDLLGWTKVFSFTRPIVR